LALTARAVGGKNNKKIPIDSLPSNFNGSLRPTHDCKPSDSPVNRGVNVDEIELVESHLLLSCTT
jgi:hypothetical protein